VPVTSAVVVIDAVAVLPLPDSVALPSPLVPSEKVTVPVGVVVPPVLVTVAVSVTDWLV
jgi:hypothetical protein